MPQNHRNPPPYDTIKSVFCSDPYQTVALDPARALSALTAISSRSGRNGPVISIDEILDILISRYEMDEAVEILRTI